MRSFWIPAAALVALGLGFLAGRIVPQRMPTLPPPWPSSPGAVALPPSPPPATPSVAPSPAPSRAAAIDQELAEIPPENADTLRSLGDRIRQERARLLEIRARLQTSDRDFLQHAEGASSALLGRQRLENEQRAGVIMQQLADAKFAVSEQQWLLNQMLGSDNTQTMREVRAELQRRKDLVRALEQNLSAAHASSSQALDQNDAQKSARLRAWRRERATLEAAYTDALAAIEQQNQSYRQLVSESLENKKRADQLRAERQALEGEVRAQ
jgi:hypothetical protein